MTVAFNKLADRVFQTLKGYGYDLKMFDETGKKVIDPEEGRHFYAMPDQIMVSLREDGADSEIRIYLSRKDEIEKNQDLLDNLRKTSVQYGVGYTAREYGRSITPRDFAHMIKEPHNTSTVAEQMTFLRSLIQKNS